MIKYILKRIVQVIPVLLGVSIIVFLMLSLSPGDPARLALGMNAKPEQIEAFNHENGLDQPVLVQYVNYMKGLVTGNLGVSYTTKQSVAKMIAVRLPATCILAFGSLVLTYLIAIPLGILLAVKQNTFFDDAFRVVALIVPSARAEPSARGRCCAGRWRRAFRTASIWTYSRAFPSIRSRLSGSGLLLRSRRKSSAAVLPAGTCGRSTIITMISGGTVTIQPTRTISGSPC